MLVAVMNFGIDPVKHPWFYDSRTGATLPFALTFLFPDPTYSGRLSDDGQLFLLGGLRQGLKLWEWRTGAAACPDIPAPERSSADFVHATPWIFSAGAPKSDQISRAQLWDRRTGRALSPAWTLPGSYLRGFTVAPDGRCAVTAEFSSDFRGPFGFHITSLAGPAPEDLHLPEADRGLLREINAGGRIEAGGFVRLTTEEWMAAWREFRRRQPQWHAPAPDAAIVRRWHENRAAALAVFLPAAAAWHRAHLR
jgi:hypothetical protein